MDSVRGISAIVARRSGYEGIAISHFPSYVMAGIAARSAIDNSSHHDEIISPIIYADTPLHSEHAAPACYVQRLLQQEKSLAFELHAASDAGVIGLEVAARLMVGDPDLNTGLVITTSRCPEQLNRWISGVLIGDGAAAVVLSTKGGFARLIASKTTSVPDFEVFFRNKSTQAGAWALDEIYLSPYIETLAHEVSTTITAVLDDANISIADISHFCLPALPLLAAQEIYLKRNEIPLEKTSCTKLMRHAHIGPCDQFIAIDRLVTEGALKSGDFIMTLGGGLGWRFSCLLLQVV
ncbi:3-oxoacyl-[acyl-carrier-protein] synthase III C-terminal domain-containing protein [Mycobacterium marinum]|uniref:3-oxoacyl-[acyl-carrier-protein] synthase III C-terminal domain-containing protein n=1 Tax=Mycobacterium marinum TaxID=1781 RepID=UPI000E3BA006|nr:3-oxoacyl-[acyl-carrier-protein] synthase III C-terminal domain-containing protein [Mycobacterium marinum]